MANRHLISSQTTRLLQLAATLLVVVYMLIIGGSFDATLRFRVQLLNALAATAIALIWLGVRFGQKRQLTSTGLELPLLAFALSQWIATATSAQPRLSLELAVSVTAWAVAFLILCDLLASGWPRNYIINALLLAAAIITAQALWEVAAWFALWAGLGQSPPTAFRLNGFLGHPNLTAAALNLLLPLVIAQMLTMPKRFPRLTLAALALSMLAAEFFSSSRGGWIAGAAELGLLAGLLLMNKVTLTRLEQWRARWRNLPLLTRMSSGMLGVSVAAFSLWLLGKQTQQVTHGSFLISRRDFWGPATVLFKAHPLTGAGPDLYTWFYPGQFSIPPGWLPPHAHSLLFQIISGSGLLGIAALLGLGLAGGVALRRRWSSKPDRLMTAALLSSLAGVLIHHLFDYLFGTPIFAFLFVVVSALAFAPEQTLGISSRSISPRSFILPLALTIGITAFSLRGAALNDQGLQLARRGDWAGAALAFQHAAETDPGLTLYWEEAAQALTRAGDVPAAIPLWQRAARDDPYWALWPGTLAVLTHDPAAMQSALKIASRSDLLALNAGVLFESGGDLAAAREAYHRALTLNPTSARGLFWQQTHFRAALLAEWQATQPVNDSPLAQGWEALEAGDADRARALFEQARAADPLSNEPYVGLARVEWAVGNEAQAERTLRAGQTLQVAVVSQKIAGLLLEGDWATAHGDRATALTAYTVVFSAVNDYTILGPGTYGYPARSWYVFHRAALPSDLIPQFARADITPELDSRFAQLAQWYAEDGELGTACFIVKRVYAEAPISQSGRLKEKLCR